MISRPDSLRDVYGEHLRPRQAASEGTSTTKHYTWAIGKLEAHLGRVARLDDLEDETIWSFLCALQKQGHAPGGVVKVRDVILSLWRFCNRKGLVELGPDVPAIHVPEKIPFAWRLEELKLLFWSASQQPGKVCGIRASYWWPAFLRSIFDSAERVGCVLQWKWEHLDESTGDLSCPAEIRKGKRKSKVYGLRTVTLEAVLKLPRGDLIFPWDKSTALLYDHYNKILSRAGLPKNRQTKFHCLRKSHASYLKLAGGDPTESLGHDSVSTTRKYLSPRILQEQRHSDLLPEV